MTAIEITEPGIFEIPEEIYHEDPVAGGSLSCSGAKKLLDCPIKFEWERTHREHKDVFDFGHAAHTHLLGIGAPVDILHFDSWRTEAAKKAKAESHLYGRTPILVADWEIVEAMVAEVRRHPIASRLLNPEHGMAEQSLFWRDSVTGIMLRARADWLPNVVAGRRYVASDYKTARSSDPNQFARAVADCEYHQQDAWYTEGVRTLLGIDDPAFLFIVQEKTAPYVVTVIELDDEAKAIGAERNRRAIDLYVEYSATGVWPGYSTQIERASLPRWAVIEHEREYGNAQF